MSGLTPSALALCTFFATLALCCAVKTIPGGSMDIYFCEPPGCTNNVTAVFCNDTQLLDHHTVTKECEGLPPLNTVCKRAGREFVSTHKGESCEFEGNGYHITTTKCQDNNTICAFDREAPGWTTKETTILVVGLVSGSMVVVMFVIIGFKYRCRNTLCHPWRHHEPNKEADKDPEEVVALGSCGST